MVWGQIGERADHAADRIPGGTDPHGVRLLIDNRFQLVDVEAQGLRVLWFNLHRCSSILARCQSKIFGSSPQIAEPALGALADPARAAAANGEPTLALSVE
jgi:hypothetical protein